MILDLPGSVITWNYTATSYVVKLFSCLSFNVALTLGVHIMELHDASGKLNHMIQANANSGIYTTLAVLSPKSVLTNLSSKFDRFLAAARNSTPIMASILMRLHVTYPRPFASAFCVFPLFITTEIINNFAFRHRCDFYAAVIV